jgi:hypothetical protein
MAYAPVTELDSTASLDIVISLCGDIRNKLTTSHHPYITIRVCNSDKIILHSRNVGTLKTRIVNPAVLSSSRNIYAIGSRSYAFAQQ